MHRVELKALPNIVLSTNKICVPNAPCGVESLDLTREEFEREMFLMHRVELKGTDGFLSLTASVSFLMHRVELKGL